jgi:hypothetical protein
MTEDRPAGCAARQSGDMMTCHRCGLSWSTNDTDPPRCAGIALVSEPDVPPRFMTTEVYPTELKGGFDLTPGGLNLVDPTTNELLSREAAYDYIAGVDLAAPDGEYTVLSIPAKGEYGFADFASAMGFDLNPYERTLIAMLDKNMRERRRGRTNRRRA